MLKLPKIIGHRGVAAYAPENTLDGIHMAADMDVKWVELDVKLTRDQVPIIFHDETLERTTGASGNVADTDYDYIKQLEAGSWFGESFAGIKVPTLEEAVDVLLERGMGLNLEIKACPGREKETAEVALDALSQIWDDHGKLLISSFSHVSLETAMDMAGDWARGLLIGGDEMPENWADIGKYLQVETVNLGTKLATETTIRSVIEYGWSPLVWTVNTPEEARMFQGYGVDTLFSDVPDVIQDGLLTIH